MLCVEAIAVHEVKATRHSIYIELNLIMLRSDFKKLKGGSTEREIGFFCQSLLAKVENIAIFRKQIVRQLFTTQFDKLNG